MDRESWKVIKIIDDYNIVINGGKDNFLNVDDEFEIYVAGEPIIDPDTSKVLGNLDFIKARVYIKNLFNEFSICSNVETVTTNALYAVSDSFKRTRQAPLKVDSSQITGYGLESDKAIKIGDLVRKSL